MDIQKMEPGQKQRAAQVYYRAFANYPMMTYYFQDTCLRERYLEWYLGCALNYSIRYGEVQVDPQVNGLICWLPPDKTEASLWGYMLSGFLLAPLRFGIRQYMRVVECEDYTGKIHKQHMPGPHYYVWGVAVDPDCQGQGLGRRLLAPGLARAEQEHLPVYLETHDEKNITFYQKMGFELISKETVPKHNLPFWCFVHRPGSG